MLKRFTYIDDTNDLKISNLFLWEQSTYSQFVDKLKFGCYGILEVFDGSH